MINIVPPPSRPRGSAKNWQVFGRACHYFLRLSFLAIAGTAPGFMITKGKSHWQRVIEMLNGSLMVVLLMG